MGCDIHLTVEIQDKDGVWHGVPCPAAPAKPDDEKDKYTTEYWDSWGRSRGYKEERGDMSEEYDWSFGRIYSCFALMANVRNGDGVTPISNPKGFPQDASEESIHEYCLEVVDDETASAEHITSPARANTWVKRGSSERIRSNLISGPDWHNPSWLSLTELNDVDEKAIPVSYILTYREYEELRYLKKHPENIDGLDWYNMSPSQQSEYRRVNTREMNRVLKQNKHPLGMLHPEIKVCINVKAKHPEPGHFNRLFELRDLLRDIQKNNDLTSDQVRIVFYFDN